MKGVYNSEKKTLPQAKVFLNLEFRFSYESS